MATPTAHGQPAPGAAPIVVMKRRKKSKHSHHGGAWKLAYADFMTAMMALFLVLWLLGQVDQNQLKGISEYFSTPLKVAMMGGKQSAMTSKIIPGGGQDPVHVEGQQIRINPQQKLAVAEIQRTFFELMQRIRQLMLDDPELKSLVDQVRFEILTDGLLIEFVDSSQNPMFNLASAKLSERMEKILRLIGPLFNDVGHLLSISGHTDARPFTSKGDNYSNWELSSDRAHASRRVLVKSGMFPDLIFNVEGRADKVPLSSAQSPRDPQNRRIAIFVHGDIVTEDRAKALRKVLETSRADNPTQS